MEPYTPEFRRLLKETHPGLQDADIDRLQELTTRRATLQGEANAGTIALFDEQIDDLLSRKMPEFEKAVRLHAAVRHAEAESRITSRVDIRPKR